MNLFDKRTTQAELHGNDAGFPPKICAAFHTPNRLKKISAKINSGSAGAHVIHWEVFVENSNRVYRTADVVEVDRQKVAIGNAGRNGGGSCFKYCGSKRQFGTQNFVGPDRPAGSGDPGDQKSGRRG